MNGHMQITYVVTQPRDSTIRVSYRHANGKDHWKHDLNMDEPSVISVEIHRQLLVLK